MDKIFYSVVFIVFFFNIYSQSLNEFLGFKDADKLLIIHADDLGFAHSENAASFEAMKSGVVNSGSIIVPGPWFLEVVNEYRKNPHFDLGIHLAVTSEWRDYKWGPVSPVDKVKSLVNQYGYFYSSVDSVVMHAKPEELELELTNQIEKCLNAGLDITHLDGHMGFHLGSEKFLDIYIKLGKKYQLPILFNKVFFAIAKGGNEKYSYFIDNIYGVPQDSFPDKMITYYHNLLSNFPSGISEIILHTAYDDAEMQAICVDHPYWGSAWRQQDYNFVMNEETIVNLRKNDIKLVTWREIRDKVIRK